MKTDKVIHFFIILLFSSFLNSCGLSEEEKQIIAAEKLRIEQEELATKKAEEQRLAQLNSYQSQAEEFYQKGKVSKAILYIDSSLSIAIKEEGFPLLELKAECSYKNRKYEEALAIHTLLISDQVELSKHYYERALCYEKLKKRQEAVNDLKESIALKNTEAEKLHDKINPLKKRISYYVTRCCDGSTSNAKGRGACSHHGGVCNWNDPVYEEYRKY